MRPRVGLIGYGHMGRLHARHLAAVADVVLVDPPLGLDEDLARVDAAIIAVPTTFHAAVALPLLRRGVPCLIEKPLAATLEDARALAAFPNAWVGHVERFNPAFSALGGLDARFVQAERVSRWSPRGTDVDVVLDLMIHDLDLFCALAPEPVVEVRASGAAMATQGLDLAHARVETASGRVGTFTASRLARQASRRFRVFSRDPSEQRGEYWSVDLRERQAARVRWEDGALTEERVEVAPRDALGAQLRAFLACVAGGALPDGIAPATAAEGLRALDLALRIRACALA